jgi:hypothetical protein
MSREWYRFFFNLYEISGGGDGIIPVSRGGTGTSTTPADGRLLIGNGAGYTVNPLGGGAGINVLNAPGNITLVNSGVLSNIAGTGVSVDAATGDVTISNTGVLSFAGGTTGLTPSASTTGAVTLAGTLNVANGGTGAVDAAGARANLSAAVLGANNDITSMTGLTGGIETPTYIQMDTTVTPTLTEGMVAWSIDDGTLDIGLFGGAVLQTGQETLYYAKNTSGSLIPNGTPVMFTGTVGASGKLTFGLAVANGSVPSDYMMGVTTQDIAHNAFGYITHFGLVREFDTTGTPYGQVWADGDLLYFDAVTPGGWTNVQPQAPAINVPVAVVVNAGPGGAGSIFVRMSIANALSRLQDVFINGIGTPATGDLLQYDAVDSRWENRSVTGVLAAASGAPVTKTADFTVAANETWLINNKSGSTCTVTLPAPSALAGRTLYFQNYQNQFLVSASSNVVPLAGGAASTAILADVAGAHATVVSDGSNWLITQYGPNNALLLE